MRRDACFWCFLLSFKRDAAQLDANVAKLFGLADVGVFVRQALSKAQARITASTTAATATKAGANNNGGGGGGADEDDDDMHQQLLSKSAASIRVAPLASRAFALAEPLASHRVVVEIGRFAGNAHRLNIGVDKVSSGGARRCRFLLTILPRVDATRSACSSCSSRSDSLQRSLVRRCRKSLARSTLFSNRRQQLMDRREC